AVTDVVDKTRFRIITMLIMRDRRFFAVCEDEAGDIDGIGARMLAELDGSAGADDRAAGESTEMFNRHHRAADVARSGWRDDMFDEHREIDRERAACDEAAAESRAAPDSDALDIVQLATARRRHLRHLGRLQPRGRERGTAISQVAA